MYRIAFKSETNQWTIGGANATENEVREFLDRSELIPNKRKTRNIMASIKNRAYERG